MNSSDSCVLSVDAGGTSLKAALVVNGSVRMDSFFSIPVRSDGSADEIKNAYAALGKAAGIYEARFGLTIHHVSVCIPGPFDYPGGRCLMKHKYQSVYGMNLRPWIEEGIGRPLPICFLHDSTAFLLGAATSLTEEECSSLCGVIIGTGLGFASMADGRILEQPSGGPGISIFGRPYLGKTAEDYVSRRGIIYRYRQLSPACDGEIEVKEIADRARAGSREACAVFHETGEHLAAILLPVVQENGFRHMLLGGAISKSADLFLPDLKKGLKPVHITVEPARDPDMAPLLGAAQYSFN